MSTEKRIKVTDSGENMTIITSRSLGLFMARHDVNDLVSRFGSRLRKSPDFDEWSIIPPISKEHVEVFGRALVELAQAIDPDSPAPSFELNET